MIPITTDDHDAILLEQIMRHSNDRTTGTTEGSEQEISEMNTKRTEAEITEMTQTNCTGISVTIVMNLVDEFIEQPACTGVARSSVH